MSVLQRAQQALRDEARDGWLLYNIYHRDHIADHLLGVREDRSNTRPWAAWIPAVGEPRGLVHRIEAGVLGSELPVRQYSAAAELSDVLRGWLAGTASYALNYSAIPRLSVIDHATALLLHRVAPDATQHPADTLVQRALGTLDDDGLASHRRSADHLYDIVATTWRQLGERLARGANASEAEVQQWVLDAFAARSLRTEHAPIVAAGDHSSDPHHEPRHGDDTIAADQVLQLDLWAKEQEEAAVYADISWVGFTGATPPAAVQSAFAAVVAARDAVLAAGTKALARGERPTGAELDERARDTLAERGMLPHLRHRTGHAIDRLLHGIGVNLDAHEFPD